MSEWISVKDRLPESFELVMTYERYSLPSNGKNTFIKIRKFTKNKFVECNFVVTHWQPLPAPPKG